MRFGFTLGVSDSSVVVVSVENGSIASEAKLTAGDKITKIELFDGETVKASKSNLSDLSEVSEVLSQAVVGNKLVLTVSRTTIRGGTKTVYVEMDVRQYYFCNTEVYTGITDVAA